MIPHINKLLSTEHTQKVTKGIEYDNEKKHLYSSCDIRHAGYKIAPVDVNLFPAAFSYFNKDTIEYFKLSYTSKIQQRIKSKKLLIILEWHTRNKQYLESIKLLQEMLESLGYEINIGSYRYTKPKYKETNAGDILTIKPLIRVENKIITTDGYEAEEILLQNDCIIIPKILYGLTQKITPSLSMTWQYRRKSDFFIKYDEVVTEFSDKANIDSWLLSAYTESCQNVNFMNEEGIENLMLQTALLLEKIKKKYQEYNITQQPYIFIKANNGTYGMGITTIKDASDLKLLSQKIKNRLSYIKFNTHVTSFLLQEGVPSIEQYDGHSAEIVSYEMCSELFGYLCRYHKHVDNLGNLNIARTRLVDVTAKYNNDVAYQLIRSLTMCALENELNSSK